jgi:hypothetical protein
MSQVKPAQSYIDEQRAGTLLEKWAPVLDYSSDNVAPITDDHSRLNTAILLENQESWCLNENSAGMGGVFGGGGAGGGSSMGHGGAMSPASDFYAKGDARLPKILIPMIRRTFPELITNEIVGVQPMSGPVGLAFAMRYKYEDDSLGGGIDGHGTAGGGVGLGPHNTQSGNDQPSGDGSLDDLRETGKDEVGYQDLDTRFTGTQQSDLSAGWNNIGEFVADDAGVAKKLADYELTGNIPQMVVSFEKTAVEAGTRRLAARWSVELEQDLKNMNGIDIDTELTNAMSYEIQAEIDREMLMRMVQVAAKHATGGKGVSTWSPAKADGRWMAERNRDLYAKIIVEANRIAIRNRRGAANFLVATPRVCAILEMLPEFQWMQVQGNVNTQPVGIARVGNLGGRFNVYRDTRTEGQFEANKRSERLEYILLGYKGPEFYDTGIIYCPYIPVMVQRTVGPNDFAPRVGLLTRYGVVDNIFGAELYYHVIVVNNLGDSFTPGTQSVYFG